jgi:hypothetical protein
VLLSKEHRKVLVNKPQTQDQKNWLNTFASTFEAMAIAPMTTPMHPINIVPWLIKSKSRRL